jgi:hypothetical protein
MPNGTLWRDRRRYMARSGDYARITREMHSWHPASTLTHSSGLIIKLDSRYPAYANTTSRCRLGAQHGGILVRRGSKEKLSEGRHRWSAKRSTRLPCPWLQRGIPARARWWHPAEAQRCGGMERGTVSAKPWVCSATATIQRQELLIHNSGYLLLSSTYRQQLKGTSETVVLNRDILMSPLEYTDMQES